MVLDPEQFWRRKPRHHQVTGNLPRAAYRFFQLDTLVAAAAVIPQNSRTQHALLFIQQRCAVHLPGDPHRFYIAQRVLFSQRFHCAVRRLPPVLGVLLGP